MADKKPKDVTPKPSKFSNAQRAGQKGLNARLQDQRSKEK
jgi:hypothetical protein